MLILNMILRITGFTQDELAKFIGVSRASINTWLTNDDGMSDNSKKIICDKFQIPMNYFKINLNQDLDYYKLVFSTIYENWKRINNNEKEETTQKRIDDILNQIDSNIEPVLYESINELEILEGLSNGYNPFTGEVFEEKHILNNENIKEALTKIYKNYSNGTFKITKEDLNKEQLSLFEELRKWRKEKSISEGYYHAYIVFSDRELINIVTSNIKEKTQLINVKGIGNIKYDKYADELFEIIKTGKYNKLNQEEKNNNDDYRKIENEYNTKQNYVTLENIDLPF